LWKAAYPRDHRPVNALALIYNRFGNYERAVTEANEALRRSPGNPFPMSNLAFAYRGLGKYGESRKVADEAVRLGVATTPTRRLLYQLGIMANDGSATPHLEWAKSQPRESDLVSARAQVAAFAGRMREASQLYAQAADIWGRKGDRVSAAAARQHAAALPPAH
jgi:tetratricopeptide (TPR) repeat protein